MRNIRVGLFALLFGAYTFVASAADVPVDNDVLIFRLKNFESKNYVQAVDKLEKQFPGKFKAGNYASALSEIDSNKNAWISELAAGNKDVAKKVAKAFRSLDNVLLQNPLIKDKKIVAIRRNFDNARSRMSGSLGIAPSNFQNNAEIGNPLKGWDNEIVEITNVTSPKVDVLYKPTEKTIITDLEPHFDGERIMYSSIGTHNRWHLFEVDKQGKEAKQLTPAAYEDFDSFDGCYTPDGKYLFCATATFLGLPCTDGGNKMCGLFLYDPKDGTTRQLTFDQDSNWGPVVMNNGTVLYQRWEYADLPHSNSRMMFTMNPDGTAQQNYYNTGSYFPTSFFYARPVPGHATAMVGVAGGHHSVSRSGRLLIIDPAKGRKEAKGVIAEIPNTGKPVAAQVRDRLPDGVWPQFLHPYPLSDTHFLVSMKPTSKSLWGLYLVDTFNNMIPLYMQEDAAILEPFVLEKRNAPAVIPSKVDAKATTSTVFLQDVYAGEGLKGVPRGEVKKLRIGSYSFSPWGQGGLLGTLGMDGPWDVKRILGEVDVEEDGSAMFVIPANTPVFVQPIDKDGKALQVMRSWFTGMPGETVSCIGCHEDKNTVPVPKASMASRKKPQMMQDFYGKERGFSYRHEIQPILDKNCVSCHNDKNESIPSFEGVKWIDDWTSQIAGRAWNGNGGHFTQSYANLHRYVRRPGIESDMDMLVPMDVHADQTELMQILNKEHKGVKLSAEEIAKLACWIDFNAQFHGRRTDIPKYCDAQPSVDMRKKYEPMLGVKPADIEYLPDLPSGITAVKPVPLKADTATPVVKDWPFHHPNKKVLYDGPASNRQLGLGFYQLNVPLTEKVSIDLIKVPAGSFVMGSKKQVDEMPQTAVAIDKSYWIGKFEVTNELYALYDAQHDSRTEHRHGYQFGRLGYPLNKPDQPVVRISWEDAMGFCKWLSDVTGKTFTLPTEAQWEWACRAGSATDFSFGELGADFTNYANLGDIKLKEFASCSSFKFYESVRVIDDANKYDDWIPRDTTFNDGGFVSENAGRYRPNIWDIHDMHGNVAEWTLSSYKPYPYNETDGRNDVAEKVSKVVRGGSWYDRPHKATSSYRQAYRPYQKVFNVGFRVVMIENEL